MHQSNQLTFGHPEQECLLSDCSKWLRAIRLSPSSVA